jgi:hypothetical protein
MPTEEDLRATLIALEPQAPDALDTLAGLDRRRRRRSTRQGVIAVIMVSAVTLGVAGMSILIRDRDLHAPAVRPAAAPLEFRFAVDDIPGFTTYYQSLQPDRPALARVFPSGATEGSFDLFVFSAGGYDPAAAQAGTPVEVRGKPGFYRTDLPCHCGSDDPGPGVAWEYAPNTWALVRTGNSAGSKETMTRIAAAVRFDKTTPVRVPFRIGWLPEGFRLTAGDMFSWAPPQASADITLVSNDSKRLMFGVHYWGPPTTVSDTSRHPVADPTLGRVRMEEALGGVSVDVGPFQVQLSSDLDKETVDRIARSITAAGDISDPRSWIPAVEAIPAA